VKVSDICEKGDASRECIEKKAVVKSKLIACGWYLPHFKSSSCFLLLQPAKGDRSGFPSLFLSSLAFRPLLPHCYPAYPKNIDLRPNVNPEREDKKLT
jgi:hypothetical protein